MIELELRNNPAPLIPGWDGPEQSAFGNFDGDALADDIAVVAEEGGSCRVMVFSSAGEVLVNVIVFEQSFRGGGRLAVITGSLSDPSVIDSLLVVPGPGGGPRAARFDLASGDRFDFFAPYPETFRGGLWVSSGDIDRDGIPEALFLPGEGGGPQLVAVDMTTFETELSIFVGDPADRSGDARFEPTGGTITNEGQDYFYIQYGDVVDSYVESRLIPIPRS